MSLNIGYEQQSFLGKFWVKDGGEEFDMYIEGYVPVDKDTRKELSPGLVIHKEPFYREDIDEVRYGEHGWVISHVNSGCRVSQYVKFDTRIEAFEVAILATEIIDEVDFAEKRGKFTKEDERSEDIRQKLLEIERMKRKERQARLRGIYREE